MSENSIYKSNSLSILILQDGFSFLVLSEFKFPLAFEHFRLDKDSSTTELLKVLKSKINSEFLNFNNIKELEVIYGNPQFSIVPQVYFEESHLPHYLKYSSKLIEGDDFSYDEIHSIQANTVYIPFININNYLFDEIGTFKFTHIFTGLIENAFQKSFSAREYLRVHVGSNTIYLTAFKDQKMILTNAFTYETPEDLVYFILFSIEELKLDREQLTMDFTGNFYNTEDNTAYHILSLYVRNIFFTNTISSYGFEQKVGFQEHFNLL